MPRFLIKPSGPASVCRATGARCVVSDVSWALQVPKYNLASWLRFGPKSGVTQKESTQIAVLDEPDERVLIHVVRTIREWRSARREKRKCYSIIHPALTRTLPAIATHGLGGHRRSGSGPRSVLEFYSAGRKLLTILYMPGSNVANVSASCKNGKGPGFWRIA